MHSPSAPGEPYPYGLYLQIGRDLCRGVSLVAATSTLHSVVVAGIHSPEFVTNSAAKSSPRQQPLFESAPGQKPPSGGLNHPLFDARKRMLAPVEQSYGLKW